jgi:hypothetical protein
MPCVFHCVRVPHGANAFSRASLKIPSGIFAHSATVNRWLAPHIAKIKHAAFGVRGVDRYHAVIAHIP